MDPQSPKRRFAHLLASCVISLVTTGCLALGLATRGAPEGELRSFELELAPVDLPATDSVKWEDGSERWQEPAVPSSEAHADHGSHGSVVPPPLWTTVPVDGWLHGFEFRVLDESGAEVPPEVLHHLKVMAPERRELFSPLMLRLAGAGSETQPVVLPTRVGYPLSRGDSLLVTAMLHSPTGEELRGLRVSIRMHYTPAGSWRAPAEVVPFFTHVTPPGEETSYDLPPGRSERSTHVRPAVSGIILGLGGHLHRYGVSVRLQETATGRTLWEGKATRDPAGGVLEVDQDVLVWSGGIELRSDRTYRVTAVYENPTGRTLPGGGMGTLGGIVLPDRPWPAVDRKDPVYLWDIQRETKARDGDAPAGDDHVHTAAHRDPRP